MKRVKQVLPVAFLNNRQVNEYFDFTTDSETGKEKARCQTCPEDGCHGPWAKGAGGTVQMYNMRVHLSRYHVGDIVAGLEAKVAQLEESLNSATVSTSTPFVLPVSSTQEDDKTAKLRDDLAKYKAAARAQDQLLNKSNDRILSLDAIIKESKKALATKTSLVEARDERVRELEAALVARDER
ncbi:hypothetical protein KIPB_012870, partial [Kipferlia bialata]|eukprot:g12870.t1